MKFTSLLVGLTLFACSTGPSNPDADASTDSSVDDVRADALDTTDTPSDSPDVADASDATDAVDGAGECQHVTLDSFTLENADDVSVRFVAAVRPVVSETPSRLELLFERYVPGPTVGRFVLGPEGSDPNYGGCQHCVAIPGTVPTNAFFADRGVLDLSADPYTRRLRGTLENVRLVEVSVNAETRESTPVPGGRCVEVETVTFDRAFPGTGWTCPEDRFADTTQCDCECGGLDPDCTLCDPSDPSCPAPLPLRDCGAGDVCRQGLATGITRCYETCAWGTTACATGQCIFDNGIYGADVCAIGEDEVSSVAVGQMCPPRAYQRPCGVVDGHARGYCGSTGVCRPTCNGDSDCASVPGTVCMPFFTTRAFGYCETPMSTE